MLCQHNITFTCFMYWVFCRKFKFLKQDFAAKGLKIPFLGK